MSFRKRSVRPNLSTSKRTITEEKLENTNAKDGKDLTPVIADSQDSLKSQDNGGNEEPIATTGRRLSKRTKIMPKLNPKKSTVNNDVNSSLDLVPIPSAVEIYQEDIISTKATETNTDVETDSKEKFKDCNGSVDVLSVYKMITGQSNGVTNEEKDNAVDLPSGNTASKEKRIPKRTKVAPKLAPRSSNRENNNDSTNKDEKTVVENIPESCSVTDEGKKYTEVMDKLDNIHTDLATNDESPNPIKSSRLQKRLKIRPKLTLRTSKTTINEEGNNEDTNTVNNKEMIENNQDKIDSNISRTLVINSCLKSPQKCENVSEEQSKSIIYEPSNEIENTITELSNSSINTLPLTSDKKESKQVRFRSDDLGENDCIVENSEENNNKLENGVIDEDCAKSPTTSDNKNMRYDSNDEYDSLSEGESLGRQLSSKNKVFKPNLGAKRRERLSSFSAYSSCDEDDWQSTKKKKPSEEKKGKETKAKDEKKKKPKSATKQKKNRENMEPNTEEVPKKRKKRETKSKKINKFHEERDLSSLTMQELIHYHPPSFKTVELRSKRDEDENERVMDLGSIPSTPAEKKPDPDQKKTDGDEVMAPQIMINEDGEIVINQDSLTISQKVDDSTLKNSAVVYEDSLSYGSHLKRKHVVGKRWKIEETLRFYKALSEIGTDFTLMSQAFGRFSRNELKKKFKKEEKVNCDLVDRALSNRLPLNMEMFLRGKEEMKEYADENDNKIKVTESFCKESTPNSPTEPDPPTEPNSPTPEPEPEQPEPEPEPVPEPVVNGELMVEG